MRKLSSRWVRLTAFSLTAILMLGPVSRSVLGSDSRANLADSFNVRPTIGGRNASLAAPTIPATPAIPNGQVQRQSAPVLSNEFAIGDPVRADRSGDTAAVPAVRGKLYDFTGNGRTDWTTLIFPGTGSPVSWRILGNPANPAPGAAFIRVFDYGIQGTDSFRPNDYRGDVKTEVTVRRGSDSGRYYGAQFPTGTGGIMLDNVTPWGLSTDVSGAEGDYDGDTKVDFTVVRNTAGSLTWYILLSGTSTLRVVPFGTVVAGRTTTLLPGADFNGDGRDELCFANYVATAAFAPTDWYAGDAVSGAGVLTTTYGDFQTMNGIPPADYTGDGRADLVEVKLDGATETWFIRNSATGVVTGTSFGVGDPNFIDFDFPVRGDYDGDGIQDLAVWRPLTQTFYVRQSSALPNISIVAQQWGLTIDDTPLGAIGTF